MAVSGGGGRGGGRWHPPTDRGGRLAGSGWQHAHLPLEMVKGGRPWHLEKACTRTTTVLYHRYAEAMLEIVLDRHSGGGTEADGHRYCDARMLESGRVSAYLPGQPTRGTFSTSRMKEEERTRDTAGSGSTD